MKNKGFTLVELIGAISVLSIIAIIVTPTIIKSLQQSNEKAYVEQTRTLERTAEQWSIKNANLLSETSDYYLDIQRLVTEDYLNSDDVTDPRTKKKMSGCIIIHYDKTHTQYTFKYTENTCSALRG